MRTVMGSRVGRLAHPLIILIAVTSCSDTQRLVFDREYVIENGSQALAVRISRPTFFQVGTNRLVPNRNMSIQNINIGRVECWLRITIEYGVSSQTVRVTLRNDYSPENVATGGWVIDLEPGGTSEGTLKLDASREWDISFDWQ